MKPTFILLFLGLATAFATSLRPKDLAELVSESEYIVAGTVIEASMHDSAGRRLVDPKARTGPGTGNEIRLKIRFDKSIVLKSKMRDLPDEFTMVLWEAWILDLDSQKMHEGKTYIFLLTGDDLRWVYPEGFDRDLSERAEIEKLMAGNKPNQPPEPTAPSGRGSP